MNITPEQIEEARKAQRSYEEKMIAEWVPGVDNWKLGADIVGAMNFAASICDEQHKEEIEALKDEITKLKTLRQPPEKYFFEMNTEEIEDAFYAKNTEIARLTSERDSAIREIGKTARDLTAELAASERRVKAYKIAVNHWFYDNQEDIPRFNAEVQESLDWQNAALSSPQPALQGAPFDEPLTCNTDPYYTGGGVLKK